MDPDGDSTHSEERIIGGGGGSRVIESVSGMLVLAHGFAPIFDACIEDPEMAPLAKSLMDAMLRRTALELSKISIKDEPS